MRPIHPSNIVPFPGLVLALAIVLVGGVMTGIAAYYFSTVIYMVLIFPLIMGFLAGWLAVIGVKLGKIRNPVVGTILGLLCGLVVYGSMWTAQYYGFKEQVNQSIVEQYGPQDRAQVEQTINQELVADTGQGGFVGFVMVTAKQGVEIVPFISSTAQGTNLGETGSYIYFLIELALVLALGFRPPFKAAAMPFCKVCRRWLGKEKLVGYLDPNLSAEILSHARSGNFSAFPAKFQPAFDYPMIGVYSRSCQSCLVNDSFLSIQKITRTKQGKMVHKLMIEGMINYFQRNDLLRQPVPGRNSSEIKPA